MSKARSMYAGSSGSNYGVNKNSPGNGNGKWQGLWPSVGHARNARHINIEAGGNNRNVVFCMNQLGGIGRISNMFATTADGVKDCKPTDNCKLSESVKNAISILKAYARQRMVQFCLKGVNETILADTGVHDKFIPLYPNDVNLPNSIREAVLVINNLRIISPVKGVNQLHVAALVEWKDAVKLEKARFGQRVLCREVVAYSDDVAGCMCDRYHLTTTYDPYGCSSTAHQDCDTSWLGDVCYYPEEAACEGFCYIACGIGTNKNILIAAEAVGAVVGAAAVAYLAWPYLAGMLAAQAEAAAAAFADAEMAEAALAAGIDETTAAGGEVTQAEIDAYEAAVAEREMAQAVKEAVEELKGPLETLKAVPNFEKAVEEVGGMEKFLSGELGVADMEQVINECGNTIADLNDGLVNAIKECKEGLEYIEWNESVFGDAAPELEAQYNKSIKLLEEMYDIAHSY